MNYLLDLPQAYEEGESWPLLLFLHGKNERGCNLNLVRRHGPPKLVKSGHNFPFVLISPQCPEEKRWRPDDLNALLDQIVSEYNVDLDRICLTGLSMGGFGTWELAASTPERFAAIAPICGGGNPGWAARLAHLRIWVFHGSEDESVPIQHSIEMVRALRSQETPVRFTVYSEVGHDCWSRTYANPELYNWMMSSSRRKETDG